MSKSKLRIKHGFNLFFDENGNTIFRAPNNEIVIKGIQEVLPKIVPLLQDGRTTNEILFALSEYDERSVLKLLDVLNEHGILEDSTLPPISKSFHECSKWGHYRAAQLSDQQLIKLTYSDKYKRYKKAEKIELPKKLDTIDKAFTTIVKTRESIRGYSDSTMDINELSTILSLSRGVTEIKRLKEEELKGLNLPETDSAVRSMTIHKNVVPSAGALYPIEVYLAVFNVNEVEEGLYHYYPTEHLLEKIKIGDFRENLEMCFISKGLMQSANLVYLMTAEFNRNQVKYGERGYRYILFEAGHIAQNVYLSSNALDIGAVAIGGFDDDLLNDFLGIDGEKEAAVYAVVLGKK